MSFILGEAVKKVAYIFQNEIIFNHVFNEYIKIEVAHPFQFMNSLFHLQNDA